MAAVIEIIRVYHRERPDIVHHVAMKPVLYGSLAARLTRVPAVVNAFGGLGFVFTAKSWMARFLYFFIKIALRWILKLPNSRLILQNKEDCRELVRSGIVSKSQVVIIRGMGVDIAWKIQEKDSFTDPSHIL